MNHILFFCKTCECYAIKCRKCGNNTCNGGSGKTILNKNCDCIEAHQINNKLIKLFFQEKM